MTLRCAPETKYSVGSWPTGVHTQRNGWHHCITGRCAKVWLRVHFLIIEQAPTSQQRGACGGRGRYSSCSAALCFAASTCSRLQAPPPPAEALREWARRHVRLRALAGISTEARLHLATRTPQNFRDSLAFVRKHAFQDETPSGGLDTIVALLKPDAGEDGSASGAQHTAVMPSVEQLMSHPREVEGLTHKRVFELVLHLIEREIVMPRAVVDRMVVDYEAAIERVDLVATSAAMGAGLAGA